MHVITPVGYSLLPNKYGGSGGLGSARGERPSSRSPSLPRRINALAPLDQGDILCFFFLTFPSPYYSRFFLFLFLLIFLFLLLWSDPSISLNVREKLRRLFMLVRKINLW